MKKIGRGISIGTLLATTFLCGCETRRAGNQAHPANPPDKSAHAKWSNGYVLLHQLMSDEQDVNKLHYIKHEQPDVKDLITRIARASGEAAKRLEEFAKEDGSVDLKNMQLPPGEQTTRDAIASTKMWELLGHTGERFELNLLLTQSEAMSYGWHLAEVASKNDSRPERSKYLADLSSQMKGFYHEIYELLLSRTKVAPAPDSSPKK